MEQKEPVLVLYDREEEYARLFSEYLKRQKELPWQIHTYTRAEELLAGEKSGEVTMLVVAESSCEEALNTLQPTCQAILNESGTLRFHQFPNINKYQEAGQVWKELLALYVETTGIRMPLLCAEYKTRFIGMYSPVHRCLQSTFALTFAQLMAEKHPTLYLNFEHYVGIIELLPERQNRDLADLLGHSEKRQSGLYSTHAERTEPVGDHLGRMEKSVPEDRGAGEIRICHSGSE